MNTAGGLTASIGLNDSTSFLSISPLSAVATYSNSTANNNITNAQFLVGRKYRFLPQPQCSGVSNPGATISDVISICPGFPISLTIQNVAAEFGLMYQWQRSTDGVVYSNISGAINANLLTTQDVTTYYQCVVTCGSVSGTSVPLQIEIRNTNECYCYPSYTNGKTAGDLISNVVLTGTTLSSNTGNVPQNPYYTYYLGQPNLTATLQSGLMYDLNVTVGTYQQQNVAVWIDLNDDTDFTPDERVGYSLAEIGSNETGIIPIAIGCNAPAGLHRMRIRDVWNVDVATIDPCLNYSYGETEDYDITIEAAVDCQAPYSLGTGSISTDSAELLWTGGCNQLTWDVHVVAEGGGLPAGSPTNPNVNSPLQVSGLSPFTTYQFYVRAVCSDVSNSKWTGPYSFTTLPVAVANDNCDSAISLVVGSTFEEHAVVGTNVGATKTLGPPNPTCAVFGFGGDVWYSVVAPADGKLRFEVRQDASSPFTDSGLMAFSGDCNSLTSIGCSDDEGIGGFSLLNLTGLTPGAIVYARVWEFANDTFGTFQFSAYNPTLGAINFDPIMWRVFPNPVTTLLHVVSDQDLCHARVFNMLGQEVLFEELHEREAQIDLSALPAGTYFVELKTFEKSKTFKICKE